MLGTKMSDGSKLGQLLWDEDEEDRRRPISLPVVCVSEVR